MLQKTLTVILFSITIKSTDFLLPRIDIYTSTFKSIVYYPNCNISSHLRYKEKHNQYTNLLATQIASSATLFVE